MAMKGPLLLNVFFLLIFFEKANAKGTMHEAFSQHG